MRAAIRAHLIYSHLKLATLMRAAIRAHLIYSHLKLATLCHRHFDFVLARCLGERPRRRAPPVRRPRFINGSFENRRLERRTGRLALGLADDAIPDGGRNQGSSVVIREGWLSDWPMTRYLMRAAIKGSSVAIELLSGGGAYTYAPSEVIRGHQG